MLVIDDDRRLESMIRRAEKLKIDKRFFKIDARTFRIVDIIGQGKIDIQKESLINATPEDLIKNPYDLESCLQAIRAVNETGDPMFQKLSITINGETTLEQIHFKRGTRKTDIDTIIAYAD